MTLAELKSKYDIVKIGGRLLPENTWMQTLQEMAFEFISSLCTPLNLAIPYADSDIYRFVEEDDDGIEWFMRKPRVALQDSDYIDIDSRLDLAFVYALAAFMAADGDRIAMELRAERICVEYACEVLRMGWPKAKEAYEEESYITGVKFDCIGRVYKVSQDFIESVIACLLCGNVCTNASQHTQLEYYKTYLAGGSVRPQDTDRLRAVDIAVFTYVSDNMDTYGAYSAEQLAGITTLFCEFDNIANGIAVDSWVNEVDVRLGRE